MTQHRLIPHDPAYDDMHNKKIIAQCSLPNGVSLSGVGEIWHYTMQNGTQSEITVVFEDDSNYPVICQYRIHLSESQAKKITPVERADCHYTYDGTLVPES